MIISKTYFALRVMVTSGEFRQCVGEVGKVLRQREPLYSQGQSWKEKWPFEMSDMLKKAIQA